MKKVEVRASATKVLYRRTDDKDNEISADHKEQMVAVRMLTERDIEKDEGDDDVEDGRCRWWHGGCFGRQQGWTGFMVKITESWNETRRKGGEVREERKMESMMLSLEGDEGKLC